MTMTINLDRRNGGLLRGGAVAKGELVLPTATAEPMRLGSADGPKVGVIIKVSDRDELPAVGAVVDELLTFARVRLAKARIPRHLAARAKATESIVPAFRAEVSDYFAGLLRRSGIRKLDEPIEVDDIDWKAERAALRRALAPFFASVGAAAADVAGAELGVELAFDLEAKTSARVRARLATAVVDITERTRELIRSYVATAVERGYSIDQLVGGVDGDEFLGLEAIFGSRAQVIAQTETATAYNLASSASWRESGLVEQVVIFDGPECGWDGHDDPDLADGSVRTLEEFEAQPISHPNCQRAAGPVAIE